MMDEAEIREAFNKVCNVLNDYQKGVSDVSKGIYKINSMLRNFKPEAISTEMNDVIEDYYNGLSSANATVDGLTERLRELESFAEVIEDLEYKNDKFTTIKEMVRSTETSLNDIINTASVWKSKTNKIETYEEKVSTLYNHLTNANEDDLEKMVAELKDLDLHIEWMEENIGKKIKIISYIKSIEEK